MGLFILQLVLFRRKKKSFLEMYSVLGHIMWVSRDEGKETGI